MLACIVEHHHDELHRLVVYDSSHPHHLITVGKRACTAADELYQALGENKVLFDDRRPALRQFMDADLLGMLVRITVVIALGCGGSEPSADVQEGPRPLLWLRCRKR